MTATTMTTIAMTMATMAVNDYGYSADDDNDDDDDDDDDEDANFLCEPICMIYTLMHACKNRMGVVLLNGLTSDGVDSAEGIVDVG